jgi:bacterioferritin-associated ferredoxin
MIVCLCRRVNDRAISAAVEGGAETVDEIAAATGAGADCGCCREAIERLVAASPCASPPCPGCPRVARAA